MCHKSMFLKLLDINIPKFNSLFSKCMGIRKCMGNNQNQPKSTILNKLIDHEAIVEVK